MKYNVTTSLSNKTGERCINAALKTLQTQMASYKPLETKQCYKTFEYNGTLCSNQTIQLEPPLYPTDVYIPMNGSVIKIGHINSDGLFKADNLACVNITTSKDWSWQVSRSDTVCKCENGVWVSDAETLKGGAEYCYYGGDNCIEFYDVCGCPVYNPACIRKCCFINGESSNGSCSISTHITYKDVYEIFTPITAYDNWFVSGCCCVDNYCWHNKDNWPLPTVTAKRSQLGCAPFYTIMSALHCGGSGTNNDKCICTLCWKCTRKTKDLYGCESCIPIEENKDDTVLLSVGILQRSINWGNLRSHLNGTATMTRTACSCEGSCLSNSSDDEFCRWAYAGFCQLPSETKVICRELSSETIGNSAIKTDNCPSCFDIYYESGYTDNCTNHGFIMMRTLEVNATISPDSCITINCGFYGAFDKRTYNLCCPASWSENHQGQVGAISYCIAFSSVGSVAYNDDIHGHMGCVVSTGLPNWPLVSLVKSNDVINNYRCCPFSCTCCGKTVNVLPSCCCLDTDTTHLIIFCVGGLPIKAKTLDVYRNCELLVSADLTKLYTLHSCWDSSKKRTCFYDCVDPDGVKALTYYFSRKNLTDAQYHFKADGTECLDNIFFGDLQEVNVAPTFSCFSDSNSCICLNGQTIDNGFHDIEPVSCPNICNCCNGCKCCTTMTRYTGTNPNTQYLAYGPKCIKVAVNCEGYSPLSDSISFSEGLYSTLIAKLNECQSSCGTLYAPWGHDLGRYKSPSPVDSFINYAWETERKTRIYCVTQTINNTSDVSKCCFNFRFYYL